MSDPDHRRGRSHDAQGARQAILDAAEKVFTEHGFDGARIDVIASAAGYNKSLIFQYFGDKLGLYEQVIRRADQSMQGLQAQVMTGLLEYGKAINVDRLRAALKKFLNDYFDYLIEHPRFARILLWEMAEGWQTFAKIVSQRDMEDIEQFGPLIEKMQKEGLLRSDFNPLAQFMLIEFLFPCYLASIPLYHMFMPGEDFSSPKALACAREFVIDFVLQGLMADPSERKPMGAAALGQAQSG